MALFGKKEKSEFMLPEKLPEHVGFIMDGNGRWAKKRGLPRSFGHREGAKQFKKIVRYCKDIGLKNISFYAFSTENWQRPSDEVNTIMEIRLLGLENRISRLSLYHQELWPQDAES